MKNRSIHENVVKLISIMEHCKDNSVQAVLVSIDFEKTFDTIEWSAMDAVLVKFGFGQFFIRAVKVLYKDIQSCVSNNGDWSELFELSWGVVKDVLFLFSSII